ncbi:hypothetical protein [Geobacter sp. AOG2]|uniref:hypothetical protein n=1 Tax=Geobacter sp. AOG2 TaxID=1566347 RepID=UPI001CC70CAE|nr:hypothetical protein [Geobacter sp. AOG2]
MPITILGILGVVTYFFTKNDIYGNYSSNYQKIGIGFMKIAKESFYWYVPAVFSLVIILLLRLRKEISSTYMTIGFFLTYCAIGNSIYFFGRSHENNIINISIVLLFLFFYMLDLVTTYLNNCHRENAPAKCLQRHISIYAAITVIFIISIFYTQTISDKVAIQVANAGEGRLIYSYNPFERDKLFGPFMDQVRKLTNYSDKVYFADSVDFLFAYYGGYQPVGFCSPFMTWIYKKDLQKFLQGLLDNGYYLVCSKDYLYTLDGLHFIKQDRIGTIFVTSKN